MSFKPLPSAPNASTSEPVHETTPWDPKLLQELIKLLGDSSPSVRGGALSQVASLSASIEGRAALTKTDVVRVLVRLIGDVNQTYVKDALTALINLAEVSKLADQMVERNVVSRVLDLLIEATTETENSLLPLYIMLLSNVTRIEKGARKLLNLDEDVSMKGYYITKLLPIFLKETKADSRKGPQNYAQDKSSWIGSILVNATTVSEGRQMFTDKENKLLRMIIPQISASSPIRRRAALGVIRNCMFDHQDHDWILQDVEMDLLTELCLPLRGPEQLDEKDTIGMPERLKNVPATKKKEEDIESRKLILDTLTLFTATKFGRELMKSRQVYPIIRELDRNEDNEIVSQKIYELVHVLLLDDPEDEEAKERALREEREERQRQEEEAKKSQPVATEPDLDEYGEPIEEL